MISTCGGGRPRGRGAADPLASPTTLSNCTTKNYLQVSPPLGVHDSPCRYIDSIFFFYIEKSNLTSRQFSKVSILQSHLTDIVYIFKLPAPMLRCENCEIVALSSVENGIGDTFFEVEKQRLISAKNVSGM
jgi:hypothetical protein